jgi:hypothetical protein
LQADETEARVAMAVKKARVIRKHLYLKLFGMVAVICSEPMVSGLWDAIQWFNDF